MTFLERMGAETHAPMPRYLYLLEKPCHCIAATALVWRLTGWSALPIAWAVVVLYVGAGLVLWYRDRAFTWFGPGSLTGDALYHTLPSLPAPILAASLPRLSEAIALVVALLLWWQLDTAGYGPRR